MEKLSLKRETDDFSIERLKKINNELILLKDKQEELGAQWKKEKDEINEISTIKAVSYTHLTLPTMDSV